MNTYIFHREDMFYPLELEDDARARANALCNPGTTKVENARTREIVWPPAKVLTAKNAESTEIFNHEETQMNTDNQTVFHARVSIDPMHAFGVKRIAVLFPDGKVVKC